MPTNLILPQNKFGYPNRNAGVDLSHPASNNNLEFSFAGWRERRFDKKATINGTVTFAVDGFVGPYIVTGNGSANFLQYSNIFASNPTDCTMAGIVIFDSIAANRTILANALGTGGGVGIGANSGTTFFNKAGVATVNGPTVDAVNVPYFFVASSRQSIGVNFVLRRLDTGKIKTLVVANTSSELTASASWCVGNFSASTNGGAKIATAMCSNVYLSLQQLVNWSDDPWAFWFPRTAPIALKPPSGNTFSASVTEAASATDSVTVLHTIKTTLTEAASATDTDTVLHTIKTTLTESGNATDTESAKAVSQGVISESGNATDADTVKAIYTTSLTESGTATDTVTASGTSAAKKVVGWFKEWDRKRPIPLELLQGILKEQGSPWADEITELYSDAQEKEPESKKHAAALKKVIRKLPEYVLEPIDWGPIVLSLQIALTSSRSAQAIKNANEALAELQRQHREIEEEEEESIMLLLH